MSREHVCSVSIVSAESITDDDKSVKLPDVDARVSLRYPLKAKPDTVASALAEGAAMLQQDVHDAECSSSKDRFKGR